MAVKNYKQHLRELTQLNYDQYDEEDLQQIVDDLNLNPDKDTQKIEHIKQQLNKNHDQ